MRYLSIDTFLIIVGIVVIIILIFKKVEMEEKIAHKLADPFITSQTVISHEILSTGGMKVILSDGRKLWFNRVEVNFAKRKVEK